MLESCGTHVANYSAAYCAGLANLSHNGSRFGIHSPGGLDATTAIELYVMSLLILVGVVGNVLSVVVLRKDKERKHALLLLQVCN